MIACTSPAFTASVIPFRIGLSATVAWRFSIRSIVSLALLRKLGGIHARNHVRKTLAVLVGMRETVCDGGLALTRPMLGLGNLLVLHVHHRVQSRTIGARLRVADGGGS